MGLTHRAFLCGLVGLLSACATGVDDSDIAQTGAGGGATPGSSIDQFVLVDCLLPGQIRRLGTSTTFIAPRRAVKATQSDCGIRGGEYVLFDRSDYASALAALLPKAQAGDPVAQAYVGEIYEKGLGLAAPDYTNAAQWYQRAADNNYRPAQTSLGALYERGLGVPKDELKALDLYRRAGGITEDSLVFQSTLNAERSAFRQELALRNQVATSLKQQLRSTREQLARASKAPQSAGQVATLKASLERQQQVLVSQQRDAKSEAERLRQEAEAAAKVKAAEQAKTGGTDNTKAAQAGKLELVRNEQYRATLDTANRLAGTP
jgi:hypothetical protein